MAYRCKENPSRECDGCGSCQPEMQKETGVIVEATIKLRYIAYGEIERLVRSGEKEEAQGMAEAQVDDIIDCCGLAGENMTVEEVEYSLNE